MSAPSASRHPTSPDGQPDAASNGFTRTASAHLCMRQKVALFVPPTCYRMKDCKQTLQVKLEASNEQLSQAVV